MQLSLRPVTFPLTRSDCLSLSISMSLFFLFSSFSVTLLRLTNFLPSSQIFSDISERNNDYSDTLKLKGGDYVFRFGGSWLKIHNVNIIILYLYMTILRETNLVCQNDGFSLSSGILFSEPLKLNRNHPQVLKLKTKVARKMYFENITYKI